MEEREDKENVEGAGRVTKGILKTRTIPFASPGRRYVANSPNRRVSPLTRLAAVGNGGDGFGWLGATPSSSRTRLRAEVVEEGDDLDFHVRPSASPPSRTDRTKTQTGRSFRRVSPCTGLIKLHTPKHIDWGRNDVKEYHKGAWEDDWSPSTASTTSTTSVSPEGRHRHGIQECELEVYDEEYSPSDGAESEEEAQDESTDGDSLSSVARGEEQSATVDQVDPGPVIDGSPPSSVSCSTEEPAEAMTEPAEGLLQCIEALKVSLAKKAEIMNIAQKCQISFKTDLDSMVKGTEEMTELLSVDWLTDNIVDPISHPVTHLTPSRPRQESFVEPGRSPRRGAESLRDAHLVEELRLSLGNALDRIAELELVGGKLKEDNGELVRRLEVEERHVEIALRDKKALYRENQDLRAALALLEERSSEQARLHARWEAGVKMVDDLAEAAVSKAASASPSPGLAEAVKVNRVIRSFTPRVEWANVHAFSPAVMLGKRNWQSATATKRMERSGHPEETPLPVPRTENGLPNGVTMTRGSERWRAGHKKGTLEQQLRWAVETPLPPSPSKS